MRKNCASRLLFSRVVYVYIIILTALLISFLNYWKQYFV